MSLVSISECTGARSDAVPPGAVGRVLLVGGGAGGGRRHVATRLRERALPDPPDERAAGGQGRDVGGRLQEGRGPGSDGGSADLR